MRRFCISFAVITCLIFSACAYAVSLVQENGALPASPEIHAKVCDNIQVERCNNDSDLDGAISSVAVSADGEVAIISKSSEAGCDFIISVYFPDGMFKCGYKIDYDVLKGRTQLFYTDEGLLAYLCCYRTEQDGKVKYPSVIAVFDGDGIEKSYEVPDVNDFIIENISKTGMTEVYISPESRYRIEKLDEAYLSIADTNTGEIFEIYNHTAAYNERHAVLVRDKYIVFAVAGCIPLAYVLYIVRRNKNSR